MRRLRLAAVPVRFVGRRLRARPVSSFATLLAFALAGVLIGWSSVAAALSLERGARLRLNERPPADRAIRVVYYTVPLEADTSADTVGAAIAGFRDITTGSRRVRIWHPIAPGDERGVRLVVPDHPAKDAVVTAGRFPAPCGKDVCDAVAVAGRFRLGQTVRLGKGALVRIVGLGSLHPEVLPGRGDLGHRALLVPSLSPRLHELVAVAGSTVITTAPLDPERVFGYRLRALGDRLRGELVRLERSAPSGLVRASAPLPLLDRLADRGKVARDRLLLVAAQAAALVLAFAAFAASARRRETRLVEEQLETLGASRAQTAVVRLLEELAPSLVGAFLALTGLIVAARVAADRRGLPSGFLRAALPLETVAVIAVVTVGGIALLLFSAAHQRRSRLGIGGLELSALVALAIVVWQASTSGALDAAQISSGDRASPILLLLPALVFFATAVLLLRLLPLALRLAERVARNAPVGVRLTLLTAARSPGQTAAATTFLAVALGSALFSLEYRATLERQARDNASFVAGAAWRVVERGEGALAFTNDVTPITRFARVSSEPPTPVLRLDGTVSTEFSAAARIRVLAVPASRLSELLGWRDDFSPLARAEIARRLRPWPVRLTGPRLAPGAHELRVWAHAKTDFPRLIVLHFLTPGQSFEHVRLGVVGKRWTLLHLRLRASLRNAQLVGVEFPSTNVPIGFNFDPRGYVELGPIEQRTSSGWTPLTGLRGWKETRPPDATSGILAPWRFTRAPVASGIRFDLNGTFLPLVHPKLGLPDALPGFQVGIIPALASTSAAAEAVDGLLELDVPGKRIPIRVVGSARLFPTIVTRPSSFVVLDYDTLFATMNGDQPGAAVPNEAWFFRQHGSRFAAQLSKPPFRLKRAVGAADLEARLLNDPLAAGTRDVLTIAGVVAAALGLLGLVLAIRSALASERVVLAEYEALGVPPRVLRRSTQARLLVLSTLGIVAGLLGALLTVRLVTAFVAVTGTATRPLPPIVAVVPWRALGALVAVVTITALASAAVLAGRALRETAARRLRA